MRKAEGVSNTFGEPVTSWASLGIFSASVKALRGTEFQTVQQRFGEAHYKIEMRFQPDQEFRRDDGVTLSLAATEPAMNIQGVDDPDGRRRTLVIFVRELKP